MECPNCRQDAAAGAVFCNHCGTQMPAVCPSCRAHNPPGSHFCHICGDALPEGPQAVAAASPSLPDALPPRRTAGPDARLSDIGTDLRVLTVDVASYSAPRIKRLSRAAWRLSVAVAARLWQGMMYVGTAIVPRLKSLVGLLKPYLPGTPAGPMSHSATPHQADANLQPAEASAVAAVSCPRCHRISEPGSLFCFSCGLPLDDAAPEPVDYPVLGARHPAGFWRRFAAWLIDWVILIILDIGIIAVWPGFDEYFAVGADLHGVDLLGVLVAGIYYTVGVSVWATTVGKRLLGLRVLRPDGSKAGIGRAISRYLAGFLSAALLGIGYLLIALRRDKRGLHDLICGTVVTRR